MTISLSPLFVALLLPYALSAQAPLRFVVSVVDSAGAPVANAQVALILKSGAYQDAKQEGDVYTCEPTGPCVKVFAAAPGLEATSMRVGNAGAGTLTVKLKSSTTKNSTVIHRRGPLPGIEGEVNPILDNLKRFYLYTTKIGLLAGSKPALQPVQFALNRPIDAQSPDGKKFKIWIVDITQEVSLLEYTMPQ